MPVSNRQPLPTWQNFVAKWKDCQACPLCDQRDRIVLARGQVPCDVLFIGEAPGASEDATGLPFKGPAGRLMDQIIERALPIGMRYAITNLVCCFPRDNKLAGNNEPDRNDILACRTRLVDFVNLCRPRLIVCVGGLVTQYVDHQDTVPCCDIVHPAHILAHMPAVQKDYAVNKSIVQVRSAVDRMLESPQKSFTKWGTDAYISQGRGLKQRYDAWTTTHADIDVPF